MKITEIYIPEQKNNFYNKLSRNFEEKFPKNFNMEF